jgi:hypothetical protein
MPPRRSRWTNFGYKTERGLQAGGLRRVEEGVTTACAVVVAAFGLVATSGTPSWRPPTTGVGTHADAGAANDRASAPASAAVIFAR